MTVRMCCTLQEVDARRIPPHVFLSKLVMLTCADLCVHAICPQLTFSFEICIHHRDAVAVLIVST